MPSAGPWGAVHPDPYRWYLFAASAMFVLTLPSLVAVILLTDTRQPPSPALQTVAVNSPLAGGASEGQMVYSSSCAVCHGADGQGVPRLGKPLRNSAFVQSQTDGELFDLVALGRAPDDPANTSGALMPPRGAQSLSDEKIFAVLGFLREMQDTSQPAVNVDAWNVVGAGDGAASSLALELTEHPGYEVYVSSCAACHGQGAEGVEGIGLPLTTSGFVLGKSDKDLITFIKMGRASWDENNSTGMDMPPKGGNPAITEEQLQSIVDYLRALQKEAMGP